jgi:uncharacterized protein YecE (DUF72 family)
MRSRSDLLFPAARLGRKRASSSVRRRPDDAVGGFDYDRREATFGGESEMARTAKAIIRVGVGGWTFEPWRGSFYPPALAHKRELEYMSRKLTSIEVNGTFYRGQSRESYAKWRDETPDGFVFTLKGPRYATNRRVLAEAGESIERFVTGGIAELGDKLGPINWQFAPTKRFEPDDFAAFLGLLPAAIEGVPLRHAIEARHDSFRCAEFVALARKKGVAIIVAADSEYPQIADPTAPFVYVRIMGASADEPAGYTPAALDAWAARARVWAAGGTPKDLPLLTAAPAAPHGREVFFYVISGAKQRNPAAAEALIARLSGAD